MARPATGQVIERETAAGVSYSLRFRANGARRFVLLGYASQGWTRARAEDELANVMADVRRGLWRGGGGGGAGGVPRVVAVAGGAGGGGAGGGPPLPRVREPVVRGEQTGRRRARSRADAEGGRGSRVAADAAPAAVVRQDVGQPAVGRDHGRRR